MALVIALLAALLMTALGTALVLNTSAETMIASNYREAQEGVYAAEAAFERTWPELQDAGSWNPLLAGAMQSAFVDGPAGGKRILSDGSILDLASLVNFANCAKATTCSSADMNRITAERPWGANNPRWQLYSHGALAGSGYYLVVLVGDDGSEDDANPLADGLGPGAGVLEVRAEAFGPRGSHHRVDVTLAREGAPGGPREPGELGELGEPGEPGESATVRVLSWREIR